MRGGRILALLDLLISWLRPAAPMPIRSPRWPALRAAHLKLYPACTVCGATANVVPHHIVPVHIDASRELLAENLLTLCEGQPVNCHLLFGHLGNFRSWNQTVVYDASTWRDKIKGRP